VNQFPTDRNGEDDMPLEKDIQIDGQHPDSFYEDELRDLRRDSDIHRLRRRVTILSILIPCLLCAILVLAYLDVRERLSQFQTAGSREVQTLSEDVLNKAASLSDQYVKLEKTSAGIQERVEKIEGDIKKLDTSKVDKNALDMANKKRSAEVAKTFAALQKDVAEQKASLDALAKDLNQRLDDTLTPLRSDLQMQKKEMTKAVQVTKNIQNKGQEQASAIRRLSEGKVDKEALKSLLENDRVRMALLEKRIKTLVEEVLWLENRLKLTGKIGETLEAPSPKPDEPPVAGTTGTSPPPEAGKIIEQEISK
jgi:DNA repair exonuclease SbcCD ATPase subunit